MASLTGSNTDAAFVISGTGDSWGTANAATSSQDRLVCNSVSLDENVSELTENGVGSGLSMATAIARGQVSAVGSIDLNAGYGNAFPAMMAHFFGSSTGSPAEQNVSEGDYLHQITVNTTLNNVFATIAYELASDKVKECPSVACTDITITVTPNAYVQCVANYIGSNLDFATSTNTNAVLAAAGEEDTERAVALPDHSFLINSQSGGALSGSDKLNIVSWTLNLSRPQEFIGEIKGAAGNGTPNSSDLMTGTLTVVLKESLNETYELAAQNATEYKCSLSVPGTQIASGDNKKIEFFLPRMKPIVAPEYNPSGPGTNQKTIAFRVLAAASSPTGMDSVYPYLEIINERSATYISA